MYEIAKILSETDECQYGMLAEKICPLVYDELRSLAAAKLKGENDGISIQATSLVHEAYLRIVKYVPENRWDGKGHFFAAAAEAMRRILVDRARRRMSQKMGGHLEKEFFAEDSIATPPIDTDLLDLHSALQLFELKDPRKANLVKLRYFIGLTQQEAADVLEIAISTADRDWAYARAWLFRQINGVDNSSG